MIAGLGISGGMPSFLSGRGSFQGSCIGPRTGSPSGAFAGGSPGSGAGGPGMVSLIGFMFLTDEVPTLLLHISGSC